MALSPQRPLVVCLVLACLVLGYAEAFNNLLPRFHKDGQRKDEDCDDEWGRNWPNKGHHDRKEHKGKFGHGDKNHHDDQRDKKDDDKPDKHGVNYKLVAVVLLGLAGVVAAMGVALVVYRKCARAAVAPPSPDHKPMGFEGCEKGFPFPPVESDVLPAYVIAGVPPPAYSQVNTPTACIGRPPSAPPTYSSIDLQKAAQEVNVVKVKPADEK